MTLIKAAKLDILVVTGALNKGDRLQENATWRDYEGFNAEEFLRSYVVAEVLEGNQGVVMMKGVLNVSDPEDEHYTKTDSEDPQRAFEYIFCGRPKKYAPANVCRFHYTINLHGLVPVNTRLVKMGLAEDVRFPESALVESNDRSAFPLKSVSLHQFDWVDKDAVELESLDFNYHLDVDETVIDAKRKDFCSPKADTLAGRIEEEEQYDNAVLTELGDKGLVLNSVGGRYETTKQLFEDLNGILLTSYPDNAFSFDRVRNSSSWKSNL
jgi:hypothetical protein